MEKVNSDFRFPHEPVSGRVILVADFTLSIIFLRKVFSVSLPGRGRLKTLYLLYGTTLCPTPEPTPTPTEYPLGEGVALELGLKLG